MSPYAPLATAASLRVRNAEHRSVPCVHREVEDTEHHTCDDDVDQTEERHPINSQEVAAGVIAILLPEVIDVLPLIVAHGLASASRRQSLVLRGLLCFSRLALAQLLEVAHIRRHCDNSSL